MAKFTRAEVRNILGEAHTEDLENRLIALHLGVVDPLKDQLQTYKTDAEKLPAVQKELDDLKAQGDGGYKEKYEAEAKAHNTLKQQIEAEKTNATKRTVMDKFLTEKVGIQREAARTLILDAVKWDDVKLDESGALTGADELAKTYADKYKDFVGTTGNQGTPPATPPTGDGPIYKSRAEIMKIKDTTERQQAIKENLALFGK